LTIHQKDRIPWRTVGNGFLLALALGVVLAALVYFSDELRAVAVTVASSVKRTIVVAYGGSS